MRHIFTTLSLLVWLMPSMVSAGTGLKGVRGFRHLQDSSSSDDLPKEDKVKKCKKEKKRVLKESPGELKAAKDTKGGDPKLADKDKKESKSEKEVECLEWEEGDSVEVTDRGTDGSDGDIVTEPAFGSTGSSTSTSSEFQSVNVDCDAIANGSGPTDVHSVSFSVNIDILKDASSGMQAIYSAMEKELQSKVAPRIAGCSDGQASSEETTKIVNVDFGELEFDRSGCDSSLAKEARELDGICMASDVPVDVYFVGDFPENAKAKVEVAIEEHEWGVEGLLATSEVEVTQTNSSMGGGDSGGPSPGIFIGVGVAVLVVAGVAYMVMKKNQDAPLAKAELETDEESSDDEKIPEVKVEAMNGK